MNYPPRPPRHPRTSTSASFTTTSTTTSTTTTSTSFTTSISISTPPSPPSSSFPTTPQTTHPREHPTTLRKLLASPTLTRPKAWWRSQCLLYNLPTPAAPATTIKTLRTVLESAMQRPGGLDGVARPTPKEPLKTVLGAKVSKPKPKPKPKPPAPRGIVAADKQRSLLAAVADADEEAPGGPRMPGAWPAASSSSSSTPVVRRSRGPLVRRRAHVKPVVGGEQRGVQPAVGGEQRCVQVAVGGEQRAVQVAVRAEEGAGAGAGGGGSGGMDFEMEYDTEYREQFRKLNDEGKVDERVRRRRETLFYGVQGGGWASGL